MGILQAQRDAPGMEFLLMLNGYPRVATVIRTTGYPSEISIGGEIDNRTPGLPHLKTLSIFG